MKAEDKDLAKKRKGGGRPSAAEGDPKKTRKKQKKTHARTEKKDGARENENIEKQSFKSRVNSSSENSNKTAIAKKKNRQEKKSQKVNKQNITESDDNKNNDQVTEVQEEKEVWSKSKKKRMRKLRGKLNKNTESPDGDASKSDKTDDADEETGNGTDDKLKPDVRVKNGSALQKSYAARLSGSRFRILNEELYTTTSATAFERFQANPELYAQYHEGFRHQVESWPSNPVDVIYRWLTNNYSTRREQVVVADFGCGDAELAKRLLKVRVNKSKKDACPFVVHSFDLVAACDLVTACDMANVPLEDKTVDVGIFCLALMGTNVGDFLREAHRVLKENGRVKIAEVRSRFESSTEKDNIGDFTKSLEHLGFECVKVDRSNKMFVLMELKKNGKGPKKDVEVTVKPCIYKRR